MGRNWNAVGFYVRRVTLIRQKRFQSKVKEEDQECFCCRILYNTINKTDVFFNESTF